MFADFVEFITRYNTQIAINRNAVLQVSLTNTVGITNGYCVYVRSVYDTTEVEWTAYEFTTIELATAAYNLIAHGNGEPTQHTPTPLPAV